MSSNLLRAVFAPVLVFTFLFYSPMSSAQIGTPDDPWITGPAYGCIGGQTHYSLQNGIWDDPIYVWTSTYHGTITGNNDEADVVWNSPGLATITLTIKTGLPATDDIVLTYQVNVLPKPEPVLVAVTRVGCKSLVEPGEANPFKDGVCIEACARSYFHYKAYGNPNSTFTWSASGGSIIAVTGTYGGRM